ncbi:SgcJ/EcaC family oxidoreductase [Nocardiopsis sp. YSL2]|uniref:SgcJ/EcaC family oxidoreductase n=1 Tax=Nocardiopsis sp. YSL2 TaxID=2939492 RepID=UPI0026F46703|nr:SgcJ/EcaC family oxidoreductase [Nocardiopsis sp. YSL2]
MTDQAASLVAQAKEWAGRYGAYPNGPEGAALTVPLRAHAAWEANDADALAELFADNGSELIGDTQLKGREEIRSYMAEGFAGPYRGMRAQGEPLKVELLTDDVALAVTEGGYVREGQSSVAPQDELRALWVMVRRDGDWKLLVHQTSPLKG